MNKLELIDDWDKQQSIQLERFGDFPKHNSEPVYYQTTDTANNYSLHAYFGGESIEFIARSKYTAALDRAHLAEERLAALERKSKIEAWHLFIAFFLGIIIGNLLTIAGYAGII